MNRYVLSRVRKIFIKLILCMPFDMSRDYINIMYGFWHVTWNNENIENGRLSESFSFIEKCSHFDSCSYGAKSIIIRQVKSLTWLYVQVMLMYPQYKNHIETSLMVCRWPCISAIISNGAGRPFLFHVRTLTCN